MSEHIDPQGNPGTCRATTGECPYGQHFENSRLAREAFEHAASYVPEKQGSFERELWLDALDDLEAIEDSLEHFPFTVSGKRLTSFNDFIRDPGALQGNSRELAEEVARWSDYDEREEEGWPPYGVTEHLPVGSLVKTHAANTLGLSGPLGIAVGNRLLRLPLMGALLGIEAPLTW